MAVNRRHEVDMLNGPLLPRILEFTLPLILEMERYMGEGRFEPNEFTRGLYYRAVE